MSLFAGNGQNGSFYVTCQMDANTGTGSSPSACDLNAPYQNFQGVGGTSGSAQTFAGIMALTGLRMMPAFSSPPLKFRTAGFPRYGFKASLSGRAFLPHRAVKQVAR